MKRPWIILTVTLAVIGGLLCPAGAFAEPYYGTDSDSSSYEDQYGDSEDSDDEYGESDSEDYEDEGVWAVDTLWFDYLNPKDQYTISTEAQLRGLASLVNEEQYMWKPNRTESFEGVTFILTRDITLTEAWTPIGIDEQITFSGTFDGKGHTISGVELNSEDPYCGFFGHLSGTCKNLNINGSISSTSDYCGGIAGFMSETGLIDNCECDMQVAARNDVGGMAGYNKGGKITSCLNYGEIIGASMVGGIVGECRGGVVSKCGNRGLIFSNGAGSFNNGPGGIAGRSVSASTLYLCYNTGDVISSNEATGGVAGYTNSTGSAIKDCYSIGTIRIEPAQVQTTAAFDPSAAAESLELGRMTGDNLPVYAGGIAGYVGSQNVEISNCYNAGQITGADYIGGIIGKCQNELYSEVPPTFVNNYYGKGSYSGAIAADRSNKRMKVRGAATEIYDSAFSSLSSELGNAYMDDKAGDYGSQGYPVLTWQEEMQTDENLAALKSVDPAVVKWLRKAALIIDSKEHQLGRMFIKFFNIELIYEDTKDVKKKGIEAL